MSSRAPAQGRPLVSVVMAAYNAARYVGDALASLSIQTVRDIEVIVVDDGSTDGTSEQVLLAARRDGRIRLLRLGRNRGQPTALNVGMEEARGRYLAILDADDEATPERLAHQVTALERDPRLVLVGGSVSTWCDRHSVEGNPWRYESEDASIRVRSLFKSEFISGAMALDRDQVERHGLRFDETLRLGADWALSIAAMRVGRVANVRPIVMRYRVHPGQLTVGMMDDLRSDSARIRGDALASVGVRPTEDEMRTHLAVSPCNYWAFGAHRYFQARRATIQEEAERWFERLRRASARTGRVSQEALRAYLDEIASLIAGCLEGPPGLPGEAPSACPVSHPKACVAAHPCR